MSVEVKQKIATALSEFQTNNLFDNGINLFRALGYNTERQQKLGKSNYKSFKESFVEGNNKLFNEKKALTQSWKEVHLLFQLTKAELLNQGILFDTKKVDNKIIEAYLFFAIELDNSEYSRTHLSEITREINKLFPMPVMVLFKINDRLTLSVINRRLHKKDENKDVLEKITLIKDIDIANPHRGHIEILFDLGFQELYNNHQFDSFVSLHTAWQKTLDANELNKKFYQELANWYFWATEKVEFPNDIKFHKEKDKDRQIRNSTNVIRLITRLIFTWFLKEKNLVPDELFDEKKLKQIINSEDKTGSTYYKAILQNLFFATLNTPMNADQSGSRKFIKDQHLIHTLYRYERFFINKKRALELFENIPFLNGGLFECLDKKTDSDDIVRLDCFSDNPKNEKRLIVPDELFFSDYQPLDLNTIYQTKNRKYKVRGLINILNAYKFTIHENTPIEEEVALDPELLGKVFENLLASYNPETETTARKQTGSFYTPREIVNYMVDESLLVYFSNYLVEKQTNINTEEDEAKLKRLLTYTEESSGFTALQNRLLVDSIFHIKILDPACGSGAFPMGVLHKLVYVLSKIDKDNIYWRELQKQKAIKETEEAFNIGNQQEREDRLKDISDTFENNNEDYGRKLYLIENSIYGVDIQPIAVQISKLRFFISLIVDQKIDKKAENIGVRPLPNLETKFVAANTLIGIERPAQQSLRNPLIDIKERELKQVREKHFTARTPKTKEKYRGLDAKLRNEIAELLNKDGFGSKTTEMLSNWNPYDQNTYADFFDTEWMFNFKEGFDVVIGNPPYVFTRDAEFSEEFKEFIGRYYFNSMSPKNKKSKANQSGKINLFALFILRGLRELKQNSALVFIVPNNLLRTTTYDSIRKYLLDNSKISTIVDLGSGVFDNVTASTIVISLKNNFGKKLLNYQNTTQIITNINSIENGDFNQTGILQEQFVNNISYSFNLFVDDTIRAVNEKLTANKQKLGNFCIDIIEGIVAHKHLINSEPLNGYLPLLEGKDIKRYRINEPSNFLLWDRAQIHRTRPDYLWEAPLKIVIQRISGGTMPLTAAIDRNRLKTFASINNLLLKEEFNKYYSYIVSVINSKILNWYYANNYSNNSELTVNISKTYLENLPIAYPISCLNLFDILNDYLTYSKEENELSFFAELINCIVFEIYFPDEVKKGGCQIIAHLSGLLSIDRNLKEQKNKEIVSAEYERISIETHPVCKAMYFMNTIEEIAIIEGKKS